MKPLKPAHREKKRYLLLIGKDANKKNIEEAVLEYIGILGYAKSGLQIIKKTNSGLIISINRDSLDKVRASLVISGKSIIVKKVSGSIGKLK